MASDEISQNNALIRFYYGINPNKLSDSKWAKYSEEIMWVVKFNGTLVEKNG